jgi:hypothetical protein
MMRNDKFMASSHINSILAVIYLTKLQNLINLPVHKTYHHK